VSIANFKYKTNDLGITLFLQCEPIDSYFSYVGAGYNSIPKYHIYTI